ncbi:lipopolysaccharide biosynthesis protein [Jeotgalibacillus proteolyticus]|uniref:Uncharacterized protein n=1 Tax=Jeotgalibacillus proteolyticus TaxID=2082395 RepID=A0A2S5G940_9BACL|nr:polysaccharide biosynthesis C-terminal domain-containing protein [Jeotgalibacillus proteolyticus]PPA69498.1 hypothetical protein C4B60_13170 [Jeotgalibacillus proteolyticus]
MSKIDKSIVKKTFIYFIGNFASKIIMAIMIPFYAYFVTVEELGVFDYSQTLMNIIAPIIFLALWEAVLRFLIIEDDQEKKNNIIFTSLAVVIVIILFLITFAAVVFFLSDNYIMLYTSIMICVYGAAQVWQYYARALAENKVYIQASVAGTIINFLLLIITVFLFDMGIDGLFWSYIIGQISIVIIIEKKIQIKKTLTGNTFEWDILKSMLVFSLPLVLNLASAWLIAGSGRIIIMQTLGAYESGLFSFAMKFGTIVSMFGTVISMALIEEAIIKSKQERIDEYFSNIIEVVFKLFLSICILAIPFIAIFYHFLPNKGYSESYSLVPLFLIYAIIMTMSTNVGAIFQARNSTKMLFYTTVAAALVTIILSLYLINILDVFGVMIAQVTGALTLLISRWFFANKLINLKVKWRDIIILILLYLLVIIVFKDNLNPLSIIISLFLVIAVLMLNKEMIVQLKNLKKVNKLN